MFGSSPKKTPVVLPHCVYNCLRDKCPQWVVLYSHVEREGKVEVVPTGRCAMAWIPTLLTELNNTLKNNKGAENPKNGG